MMSLACLMPHALALCLTPSHHPRTRHSSMARMAAVKPLPPAGFVWADEAEKEEEWVSSWSAPPGMDCDGEDECVLPFDLFNTALVFVKPHAAGDACENFVRDGLQAAGVQIVGSGIKLAAEIDERKLIDRHYGSLAQLAMETQPADISLSPAALEGFASTYGVSWEEAVASSAVLRNDVALERLGVDGQGLEAMWRAGVQLKLAPGTYVSRLEGGEGIYTINGFYPAMRQQFVEPNAEVRYLVCEFDEAELSWRSFRQQVIGATDPAEAAPGSLRAELRSRWQELGLASAPSQGLNGVHASAGPLEGLKERCVWSGASIDEDPFAARLLESGVERGTLEGWLRDNPVVSLGGETGKVFDLTEELGAEDVAALCCPP